MDFSFAEYVLYGRVDNKLNTVYADESFMKIVSPSSDAASSYRLLDFVRDAFVSVRTKMKQAVDNGTIPDNQPIFSKFEIKRAYQSPIALYNEHVDNLMNKYISEYLAEKNNKKHVLSFNQFIKHFIVFLKNQKQHTPFTLTSFQRSSKSNIFTSGIAIDIAGMDFGVDPEIEQTILNNPCLPFYLKTCRANGFLVSQLAPTIMVADILSPGLLPYAENNEIYSTNELFTTRYTEAHKVDYDLMQTKLLDGYNLFAATYPVEKIIMPKCKRTTFSTIKNREPLEASRAKNIISVNLWLLYYTQIRNIEEESPLDQQSYNFLIKKIKTTKYLDNIKAMGYINNAFRNTYKKKYGGMNYYYNRRQEKNKQPKANAISTDDSGTNIADTASNRPILGSSGGSSGGY